MKTKVVVCSVCGRFTRTGKARYILSEREQRLVALGYSVQGKKVLCPPRHHIGKGKGSICPGSLQPAKIQEISMEYTGPKLLLPRLRKAMIRENYEKVAEAIQKADMGKAPLFSAFMAAFASGDQGAIEREFHGLRSVARYIPVNLVWQSKYWLEDHPKE